MNKIINSFLVNLWAFSSHSGVPLDMICIFQQKLKVFIPQKAPGYAAAAGGVAKPPDSEIGM